MEVLSGGYEAEYGHSTGGIINVITKSGGNNLSGNAYVFFNTYGMNGSGRWRASRGSEIPWIGDQYADYGVDLGGALKKDTLWFFVAYNPAIDETKSEGYLAQEMKGRQRTDQYAAKLTWNLGPANRLVLSLFGDPKRFEGPWNQSVGNGSPASYQVSDERSGRNAVLRYSGVTSSDRLLLDLTVGRHDQKMSISPLLSDPNTTPHSVYYWSDPAAHGDTNPRHTNGYEDGAPPFWISYAQVRTSAEAKATYFLGSHQIKAGLGYENMTGEHSYETYPAHESRLFYDDSVIIQRYSSISKPKTINWSFFVQDSWQPTSRLSVNAGLRFDQQELYAYTGVRFLKLGQFSDLDNGWSPRLGVVYDVLGGGKSKLYGSFGRFQESMPDYINCVAFGHSTFEFLEQPYGPDGRPFTADDPPPTVLYQYDSQTSPEHAQPGLKPQYLDEVILGFEWTFAHNWTAGVKGVRRSLGRVIEDMYVTENGESLPLLGWPGHGQASSYPEATRTYQGLELTVRRALADRFQFDASYVYSKLRGNYEGYYVTNAPQVSANASSQFDFPEFVRGGKLYDDRPHRLKVYGSYAFDFGLTLGSIFALQSGRPISALGWDQYNGYGDSYIFIGDRGSAGRTPTIWGLDLHAEQRLALARGLAASLILDIFNVTNQNQVVDVDDNKYTMEFDDPNHPYTIQSPYWKTPTRYQTPRLIRAGFRLSF